MGQHQREIVHEDTELGTCGTLANRMLFTLPGSFCNRKNDRISKVIWTDYSVWIEGFFGVSINTNGHFISGEFQRIRGGQAHSTKISE